MSTLGGKYISIASPQPGTSNQPYPVGNLPPFVAVVTTISSDHALLIAEHTATVLVLLKGIQASLNEINKGLRETHALWMQIPPAVKNLSPSALSVSAAIAPKSVIIGATVSNQIRTNNFNVAVSKQSGNNPETPTMNVQIRETIKDASFMQSSVAAEGVLVKYVTQAANSIVSFIGDTVVYKGILKFLEEAKNTVLGAVLPPSASDTTSSTTGAGTVPLGGIQ